MSTDMGVRSVGLRFSVVALAFQPKWPEKPLLLFRIIVAFSLAVSAALLIILVLDPNRASLSAVNFREMAGGVLFAAAIGLSIFFLFRFAGRNPARTTYSNLFIGALCVRIFWALTLYTWSVGVGRGGAIANDDAWYYQLGQLIAEQFSAGSSKAVSLPGSYEGYYVFNAFVSYLSNGNYFLTLIMNGLFSSLIVVYVFKIADLLFGSSLARVAGILLVVSPELAMWSATNLKDTQVAFIVVASTWWIMGSLFERRLVTSRLFLIGLALLYGFFIRPVVSLFAVGAISLYLLLVLKRFKGPKLSLIVAAVIFLSILGLAGYLPAGEGFSTFDKYYDAASVLAQSYSSDSLLAIVSPEALMERPWMLPMALVYTLITPFPFWRATILPATAESVLGVPGVLVLYLLLPCAAYGVYAAIKRDSRRTFLLYAWVFFIWVGNAFGGGGAIFRYRLTMLPFLVVFAAIGLVELRLWWNTLGLLYICGLAGAFISYAVIKEVELPDSITMIILSGLIIILISLPLAVLKVRRRSRQVTLLHKPS